VEGGVGEAGGYRAKVCNPGRLAGAVRWMDVS
jgi:hypothetical protein